MMERSLFASNSTSAGGRGTWVCAATVADVTSTSVSKTPDIAARRKAECSKEGLIGHRASRVVLSARRPFDKPADSLLIGRRQLLQRKLGWPHAAVVELCPV